MNTIDKIIALLKEQKKTQKELCDFLGVHKHVFTDWKAGRNKSYTKYIYQIASFLNVSVDYLVGKTDEKSNNIILTAHEMQLVLAYRTHPEMQKAVDTLLGFDSADNSVQSDIQKTVAAVNAATQKEPTKQK